MNPGITGVFLSSNMFRNIIIFSLLLFSLSVIAQNKQHNNIRFEFTAEENAQDPNYAFHGKVSYLGKNLFLVKCRLINPNADTVFFLAKTCDQIQSFLVFDDSSWRLSPRIECYTIHSFSGIIPPQGELMFYGYLERLKSTAAMSLDFDLYELNKLYGINNPELDSLHYEQFSGRSQPLKKMTIKGIKRPINDPSFINFKLY